MKPVNAFLRLASTVKVRNEGETTSSVYANTIGWFANKHNRAFGWIVTELTKDDVEWLRYKKVDYTNVKRVYSDKGNTNLVKFNLKTGTYAFADSEHLEKTDEVKFERMSKFSVFFLDHESYGF